MAVFGRSSDGRLPSTLPRLTHRRVTESLQRQGWRYAIDSDGDIMGNWDHNQFFFFLTGPSKQILHVQGYWYQNLPLDLRVEALVAINEWHRDKLWPKGYLRVDDAGRVWVQADHIVDWEHGITDEQLDLTITCALVTSLQLFDFMAERFPTAFGSGEP
jgi:hypothetical protein